MAFGTGGNARLVSLVALQAFVGVEMTGVHIGNFMAVHGDGLAFGSFGVAVDALIEAENTSKEEQTTETRT